MSNRMTYIPARVLARTTTAFISICITVASITSSSVMAGVTPVGSAFTYQGMFKDGGSPATGTYHLRFQLWDALAGGSQVGADLNFPTVAISDGLFTVALDFGVTVFDGSARWLQVQVITNGGSTITTLSPRQALTATPYALQTRGIFVDAAGKVGIGTLSPVVPLHVEGNGYALVRVINNSPFNTGHAIVAETTSAAGFAMQAKNANGVALLAEAGTNGYAAIFDGRTYINGNVGIGNSSPETSVHVERNEARLRLHTINNLGYSVTEYQTNARTWHTGVGGPNIADGLANDYYIYDLNAGVVRMIIETNGRVGINTIAPTHELSVNGNASKPGGGSWAVSSDQRLKRDVRTIDNALDSLLTLRGVSFEYIDPDSIDELPGTRIGMIAQEVEQVFPDWVENRADGFKSLTFRGFEALTVEAMRELRTENDELRARVETLERLVEQLLICTQEAKR